MLRPNFDRAQAPGRVLGFWGEYNRNGMTVQKLAAGSPAARTGLEPGDVIVAVDGVPITSWDHYRSLAAAAGPRVRLAIRNVRNGQIVEAVADF